MAQSVELLLHGSVRARLSPVRQQNAFEWIQMRWLTALANGLIWISKRVRSTLSGWYPLQFNRTWHKREGASVFTSKHKNKIWFKRGRRKWNISGGYFLLPWPTKDNTLSQSWLRCRRATWRPRCYFFISHNADRNYTRKLGFVAYLVHSPSLVTWWGGHMFPNSSGSHPAGLLPPLCGHMRIHSLYCGCTHHTWRDINHGNTDISLSAQWCVRVFSVQMQRDSWRQAADTLSRRDHSKIMTEKTISRGCSCGPYTINAEEICLLCSRSHFR